VVIPVLYMRGVYLPGEDIVGFVTHSGLHPVVVGGAFAILIVVSVILVLKLLQPLELVTAGLARLRASGPVTPSQRVLTAVVMIIVLASATSIMARVTGSSNRLRFPKEYDARVQVDFANFSSEWSTIYEFDVHEIRVYDLVYSLYTSAPTSLRLVTDNPEGLVFTGRDYIVLSEGATNLSFAQFMGYALNPGSYRLEVKTADKDGRIELYVSSRDITAEYQGFLDILDALNQGSFTVETYQAEGYELVYQGALEACEDKLLYTIGSTISSLQVSAFVAGAYDELTIAYVEGDLSQSILTDSRATMGFGIYPRAAQGKLVLSATAAAGEVYVYIKK